MKSWTAEQIRELRFRLGWSLTDLTRHFSYPADTVQKWEKGEMSPSPQDCLIFEDLACCVETLSARTRVWSLADQKLINSHLDQIHTSDIDN